MTQAQISSETGLRLSSALGGRGPAGNAEGGDGPARVPASSPTGMGGAAPATPGSAPTALETRVPEGGAAPATSVGQASEGSGQTGSAAAALGVPSIIECDLKRLYYGNFNAVRDTSLPIAQREITAFIGPSGCGKSTVLRCLNRMNDFIDGFRFEGQVRYHGEDIYAPGVDPVAVRRRIGMVFQQPNPFAMSIFKNVAFGLKLNGFKGDLEQRVEQALRGAALWDEVKDKLHVSALSLSGGQQQRLCIARAIAVEPDVLLMDEPCSALDPVATRRVEELMLELKQRYTIAIVTHNLPQAERIADRVGFWFVDTSRGSRTGYLVEYRSAQELFHDPNQEETKRYLRGEFS